MKSRTIKQFTLSLLTVLSLCVSTFAACACSHHQTVTEAEIPSCHQASHKTESHDSPRKGAVQTDQSKAFDASCVCFVQSAPKASGKTETLKIQKQVALFEAEIDIIYGFGPARAPSAKRFEFSKTSLSDSSYNIKSPRAPPIL